MIALAKNGTAVEELSRFSCILSRDSVFLTISNTVTKCAISEFILLMICYVLTNFSREVAMDL